MAIRKKIGVIFLGLATGLVLLETTLRVVGYVHVKQAISRKFPGDNSYKVLCLGDSYTYGIGASKGREYPAWLQEILNSRCKTGNFSVVNRGVSSWNTARTLRDFESYLLREGKPGLVIVLSGGANAWNAIGRSTNPRWIEFLLNIKVYKLFKLTVLNVEERTGQDKGADQARAIKQPLSPGLEFLRSNVNRALRENNNAVALAYAEKMIELAPSLQKGYVMAANILDNKLNQFDKAAVYYKRAIELDPASARSEQYYNSYTRCIGTSMMSWRRDRRIQEAVDFISAGIKRFPCLKYNVEMLKNRKAYFSGIQAWIVSDLNGIRSLCLKNGIKMILMNYPRSDGFFSNANAALEYFAGRYGVPLVDNSGIFQNLQQEGYKFNDLFIEDHHCNDNGYRIMAENIYARMAASGLLASKE